MCFKAVPSTACRVSDPRHFMFRIQSKVSMLIQIQLQLREIRKGSFIDIVIKPPELHIFKRWLLYWICNYIESKVRKNFFSRSCQSMSCSKFWSSELSGKQLDLDPGGKFNADPCRSGSETLVLSFFFPFPFAFSCLFAGMYQYAGIYWKRFPSPLPGGGGILAMSLWVKIQKRGRKKRKMINKKEEYERYGKI